ncbi:hypothetical protein ETD86_37020 [Nonomuraea turkmeniaca]|uniref:Uncharacterized protein n=1 Tax=Nonomuraea turkmeniaca TaxID=103838 RepID=A0A5S4F4H0_9ACTN|nr:hypothetical protein [Nonomuraea turkmeniaca]TMR11050.1 hypothetical protein ETD86_37020 [Nonomuraea turkmeniaca]
MTPEEVEAAAARAVDHLESQIRERDAAEEKADAHLFALSVVTAMRGQGWRPTPAKAAPVLEQQIGPPPHPETAHRGAELVRAALRGEEVP